MVRYLLRRPIAVILTFIILAFSGAYALFNLPVSLLPSVDVPSIVVKVECNGCAARYIEDNITKVLREGLTTVSDLDDIESLTTNFTASIFLKFGYGTRMDFAYIEVNEAIDRLYRSLPVNTLRPLVVRATASDIPITRLQIVPKDTASLVVVSNLTETLIRRRIEQIVGVSLVDINGIQKDEISISPLQDLLRVYNLTYTDIGAAIQKNNREFQSIALTDHQRRFFLKVNNAIADITQIKQIPISTAHGASFRLGDIAEIKVTNKIPSGYHLCNGKRGLVIAIHKQNSARLNEVQEALADVVAELRVSYPNIDFLLTQDQGFLLEAAIANLNQDIIFGGIFCVLLLFILIANHRVAVIMSISIPLSVVMSFSLFYLFKVSLNIISLSGLALGVGMVIDNSIVVLDSITRELDEGNNLDDSCVIGLQNVVVPVCSQVLTTVAVYAPLIYLSGIAGVLILDQSIALTISLSISLVIAFILNPVLCRLFLENTNKKYETDTRIFKRLLAGYHRMITVILKHKKFYFFSAVALMPIGAIIGFHLPVRQLPPISGVESLLTIDWATSITSAANRSRITQLAALFGEDVIEWESDIGIDGYTFSTKNSAPERAEVYLKCTSNSGKENTIRKINEWIRQNYTEAKIDVQDAPNSFTQLFSNGDSYFEARFRSLEFTKLMRTDSLLKIVTRATGNGATLGKGFESQRDVTLKIDRTKLTIYQLQYSDLENGLMNVLSGNEITIVNDFSGPIEVRFAEDPSSLEKKLMSEIKSRSGGYYPLNQFIKPVLTEDYKYFTADKAGLYQSIVFSKSDNFNYRDIKKEITAQALDRNLTVSFAGSILRTNEMIHEMIVIFMITLLLLYFILAVQFESLLMPLVVLLNMPLGIFGAMLLLWISGSSLDVMAAVGFVVVLGIIVDDPILKIETMNRLIKQDMKEMTIAEVIHRAGAICLKPLLLTSLTTSLAVLPIVFTSGLGSDLQKPLVYVIVGGLTIGTFFTLWLVPIAYGWVVKRSIVSR